MGVVPCTPGHYCVLGVQIPCPAGRFGCGEYLKDDSCNGDCAPGYYCPIGSTSNVQRPCGGNASDDDAAVYYCPPASGAPLVVGVGNYSTGSDAGSPNLRSGQAECPAGTYCVNGTQVGAHQRVFFCRVRLRVLLCCGGVCIFLYLLAAGSTIADWCAASLVWVCCF